MSNSNAVDEDLKIENIKKGLGWLIDVVPQIPYERIKSQIEDEEAD